MEVGPNGPCIHQVGSEELLAEGCGQRKAGGASGTPATCTNPPGDTVSLQLETVATSLHSPSSQEEVRPAHTPRPVYTEG